MATADVRYRLTQRFFPESVTIHPDWRGTGGQEGDIALIRLDRTATTVYEGGFPHQFEKKKYFSDKL